MDEDASDSNDSFSIVTNHDSGDSDNDTDE